jgi:hypothetical protein
MKMLHALALAGAFVAAVPAAAQDVDENADKFFFFNNPAISREQALADWDECRDLAGVVRAPPSGYIYTPNVGGAAGLAGAAAAGLMQGLMEGAQRRRMIDAAVRKCMNVKGYTRHSMTKEEAKALYAGGWPQIRERLADRAVANTNGATRLDP